MGKNWRQLINGTILIATLALPVLTFASAGREILPNSSWQKPKAVEDYIVFELPTASSVAINLDGTVSLLGNDSVAVQTPAELEAER